MPKSAIQEYCDFTFEVYKQYGFSDVQAAVIAQVWASPDAITYMDLAEITGYSLATISTTVNLLKPFDIIETQRKPGSKKIYVCQGKDLFDRIQQKIEQTRRIEIGPLKEQLPHWIRGAGTKKEKNHLKYILQQVKVLETIFMDIDEAFEKRKE